MGDSDAVTIQFYKYRDRIHWRHETVRLGEDEHGVWVGLRAGAIIQRGSEPPIAHPHSCVSVINTTWWFVPIFNASDPSCTVYVDISSPPRWTSPDRVEMFDLDLDVTLAAWGEISVLDEDEFDDHQVRYSYPDDLVVGARAAALFVVNAIENSHGPFDGVAHEWLARLRDRSV